MASSDTAPTIVAPTTWSLAHLSDLHLTDPLAGAGVRLRGKQWLGRISWRRRRIHIHQPAVLSALVTDLRAQSPAHVAISGDLVQLGLPHEFEQAADWLARFVPPAQLMLVPGNHEAYLPGSWPQGQDHWRPYLIETPQGEPSLQRRDKLLLIGLSSAVPTLAGLASGTLGSAQLQALETALAQGASEGLFRVVVLHHPAAPDLVGWRKHLTDQRQFAAVIARQGAGVILHGHAHRTTLSRLPGPHGPVAVIGAPSASALDTRPGRMAGYNLLRIEQLGRDWQMQLGRRTYRPHTRDFEWLEHCNLTSSG
ncbi:metallophosphoesterase [Immundisolibacter sp.]|uniref:metallophosphoesterase family protein n=1 Tax=Immundisolibacter sp. TaxID=1934948 RepID=UPI003567CC6B